MEEINHKPRARRGCGWGCLLMMGMLLGGGVLIAGLLASGLHVLETGVEAPLNTIMKKRHRAIGGEDEVPYMVERWSYGEGDIKVVRIPVTGLLMLGESSWNMGNANTVLRSIRRATHDPEVRGLLLEINSGGGGITDSDIIYKALVDFKTKQDGRMIVTLMGSVAASGAYYIALASDHIMAHPTSITGSIGVIMQSYNIKELSRKLGIQDVTIKSGENKDMLNPFQDVNPNQVEMISSIIGSMHQRFINLVAVNRHLADKEVASLADGRIFLADEAVHHKLIDSIGYSADAQNKIAELLESDVVKVYRYEEEGSILDLFRPRHGMDISLDIEKIREKSLGDLKLLYRWKW